MASEEEPTQAALESSHGGVVSVSGSHPGNEAMHGSDGLVSAMAGLDLQGHQPACAVVQGGAGDKRPLGQRGDVLGATACHDSDDEDSRCAVCFLTMVHPVRLPCDHVFCFLCVKGVALTSSQRCALCRHPIPADFLLRPTLVMPPQQRANIPSSAGLNEAAGLYGTARVHDAAGLYGTARVHDAAGLRGTALPHGTAGLHGTAGVHDAGAVSDVTVDHAALYGISSPGGDVTAALNNCSIQDEHPVSTGGLDVGVPKPPEQLGVEEDSSAEILPPPAKPLTSPPTEPLKSYTVSPNAPTESLTAPTDNRDLNYQWFYEGRNGWWQYDARTNKEIEDAYQSEATTCQVLVVGLVFVVDFTRMLQYRIRDPSKRRKIKRDLSDAPMKGIAGISASRLDGREEDVGHHDAHLPRVDEHHMSPPLHHRQHEYQTPHVGAQVSRLDVHGAPPYVHQIDDLDILQATHHSGHPVHQIPHRSRLPPSYLTDPPTDAPSLGVTHNAEAAGGSVGGMGYDGPGRRSLWMGRSGTRQPRSPPVRPPPPTVSSRSTGDPHGDACPSPPVGLSMNQCPWAPPQQHCHPSHSLRGVPSHSRVTEGPFHSRVTEGSSHLPDEDQHNMPEEFVLPEDLSDDLSSSQGAALGVVADSLPRIHLPQLDQWPNCCQCHRCHLMPGRCHLCRQLHSQAQCLDNGICPSFGECPQHCDCPGLSCDCIGPSCECPRSSCHCPGTSSDCPRPSCDCNRSTRPASEVNLRCHGAHVCCRCSSRHRPAHPPSCRLPTLAPDTDEDPGDEGNAGTDPSLPE